MTHRDVERRGVRVAADHGACEGAEVRRERFDAQGRVRKRLEIQRQVADGHAPAAIECEEADCLREGQ